MRISQEKIFQRYAFIRSISFITYFSVILFLPLVGITMYLFWEKGFIGQIIMLVGSIYLGFVLFVIFILRRCPNCLSQFSNYVIDPKNCPYCGVQLRK